MNAWAFEARLARALLIGATCLAPFSAPADAQGQTPPVNAPADPSSRARARELGDRALAAYDSGDYSTATPLFRQALERYDFPTLRLYLARSLAKQGNPVAACLEYEALLARPVQAEEGEPGTKARAAAQQERPEAEARRPRLTLVLEGPDVRELRVELSGPSRPDVVLGREFFVEPGTYQLRVTHPDGRALQRSITLSEGRVERLELEWSKSPAPALAPSTSAPSPASSATARKALETPPTVDHTPAWLTGGVTAVLLGGAVVTGVLAASRKDDFDRENRRSDVDEQRKVDLRQRAYDMQVANTAFSVAALIGAGVTAFFVLREPDPSSAANPVALSASSLGPRDWRVGVSGEF